MCVARSSPRTSRPRVPRGEVFAASYPQPFVNPDRNFNSTYVVRSSEFSLGVIPYSLIDLN